MQALVEETSQTLIHIDFLSGSKSAIQIKY